MKKTVAFAAAALSLALGLSARGAPGAAASAASAGKPAATPERRAEMRRLLEIRRGGPKVARPGSLKGRIVVVNAQGAADAAWLEAAVGYLRKETNFAIDLVGGAFAFPRPKVEGEATLFVVDDPALPRVLTAAEDRWGMMNVAPLKDARAAFFEARVRKEVSRAFAMLCGGMASGYGLSLAGAVTRTEDLDAFPDGRLPIDVVMRTETYMAGLGVTPAKLVPYAVACREGWAPPPTNDIQRAIWEKVHAIPDKPIKIEFDPKKDR